jgi:PIN domain nuclease of toxin-antitoxin system
VQILLDTHIFIWAVSATEMLSPQGRALIADQDNDIFVSVVSLWEIGIKRSAGRRNAPAMSADVALDLGIRSGYRWLPVAAAHAVAVESLPPLHGDPFDRLLIAQAVTEPLRLLTHDRQVAAYSDTVLLV